MDLKVKEEKTYLFQRSWTWDFYEMDVFATYPSKSREEQKDKHTILNLAFSKLMTTEPWDGFFSVLKG